MKLTTEPAFLGGQGVQKLTLLSITIFTWDLQRRVLKSARLLYLSTMWNWAMSQLPHSRFLLGQEAPPTHTLLPATVCRHVQQLETTPYSSYTNDYPTIEQITEIAPGNGQDFSFVGHFCAPNRVQGA